MQEPVSPIQITLPVRQLVEFLRRVGSIDNRFTGFDRANEGARIHRKLQRAAVKEHADYAAEVFLRGIFAYEEIMPYAAVCPRCGGRITSSTVWGSWISSGTVTCTHGHAWGTDLKQYRTGIKTTKCLNCNAGNTANVKETRTICHGYDN